MTQECPKKHYMIDEYKEKLGSSELTVRKTVLEDALKDAALDSRRDEVRRSIQALGISFFVMLPEIIALKKYSELDAASNEIILGTGVLIFLAIAWSAIELEDYFDQEFPAFTNFGAVSYA